MSDYPSANFRFEWFGSEFWSGVFRVEVCILASSTRQGAGSLSLIIITIATNTIILATTVILITIAVITTTITTFLTIISSMSTSH